MAAGTPEDKLIFAPESPDEFAAVLTVGSNYIDTLNIPNPWKPDEPDRP
jgi:D-methionine transport system substrate-binding protein